MEHAAPVSRRQPTRPSNQRTYPTQQHYRVILYNLPVQTSRTDLVDFLAHAGVNWASIRGLRIPGGLNVDHVEDNHTPTENAVVLFSELADASRVAFLVNRFRLNGRSIRVSIDVLHSLHARPISNNPTNANNLVTYVQAPLTSNPVDTIGENRGVSHGQLNITAQFAYSEPLDRMTAPSSPSHFRLYAFRQNPLDGKYNACGFHRLESKSMFIIGSARGSVDVVISDGQTCAMYHALIQFRAVESQTSSALPCLFDLGSTYGSFVNGQRVSPRTFILLKSRDVLCFGNCPQCFSIIREGS